MIWSTAEVEAPDAFSYWSDVICDAFVRVSARATAAVPFEGRIEHALLDTIELSTVSSGAQEVARTGRLIARDSEEFVLANIQTSGRAQIWQDGRVAALPAGAMAFVDSGRPYKLRFAGAFSQLVVRVPRMLLPRRVLADATAVALDAAGPGRLVSEFLVGLNRQQQDAPDAAAALLPHAVGLLDWALSWAACHGPAQASTAAMTRERVHRFVVSHACDPSLDADTVAAACGLSRRSLYRVMAPDSEPLSALIRRLRVTRAQQLLRAAPERPLAAVARECGFGGEAQLHRAFRAVTGMTPGAYRSGAYAEPRSGPSARG
ncbi:helix-turn-helix domain-containing protein [Streptomyces sp. NPDC088733]|uniref:AraC-like ligand-binding domain-containing protein n=1 Tax=Streptomyces sp. NPDC088733 TaxID=3365880 RepID=UPI0037FC439D